MKKLNRCTAKVGELVTLNSSYAGDTFPRGSILRVVGFGEDERDVSGPYECGEVIYDPTGDGEVVLETHYLVAHYSVTTGERLKDEVIFSYETNEDYAIKFIRSSHENA